MKKVSLSIIFFLILIFQSLIPSWATQQEILELREGIRNTTQRVQNQLHDHPDARSVIILGPTGSGKSTLINLLANKPFTSQQANIGFRVHTNEPLPDFNIGDGNIVGTRFPSAWFDHQNNAIFWDCPGFGDPRGAKADIVNAFSIHQLFKPNIKIVLTVEEPLLTINRATGFLKLLNELTNLFPDNQQINQSLAIIVSKQNEAHNIPGYLEHQILPLTQQDQIELTQPVRNLLEFLVAHPERISSFPKANGLGIYNPNMQMVRQSINSANYIENPRPNIRVGGDALLYIDSLGKSQNHYIAEYMKNNGHITIIDYCNNLVSDQPDLPLINRFKSLGRDLRDIQNIVVPQNPNLFPERLNAIFCNNFNVANIRATIENLGFLRTMRNNITYDTADWTNALLPTIGRIQELTNNLETKKDIQELRNNFQNLALINQELTRSIQESRNNFSLLKEETISQVVRSIPTGSILPFAGVNSPDGWLMCSGQIVSCNEFSNLYDIIGRTYTPINHNPPIGENLFCVPDMRGRVPVGVDDGSNRVTLNNTLGANDGKEKHQLTINEIPPHSHSLRLDCYHDRHVSAGSHCGGINHTKDFTTSLEGGGQSHNNMQPYLVLNYIIKH